MMKSIFESKEHFREYIKKYHLEDELFNEIGPKAETRKCLEFDEFFKIAMWKSVRQKNNYLKNKDNVKQITKDAFSEIDEKVKMEKLCKLKGVKVPTASAILSIVFPNKYPVIDIRCLQILKEFGYLEQATKPTPSGWVSYLQIMSKIAEQYGATPREVDKALFALHREKQGSRNLY